MPLTPLAPRPSLPASPKPSTAPPPSWRPPQNSHTTLGAFGHAEVGCPPKVTQSMITPRDGKSRPKGESPHDSRSGSCLGIPGDDYCPCTPRHAFRPRGKRYPISQPRPSRRPVHVVASLHPTPVPIHVAGMVFTLKIFR